MLLANGFAAVYRCHVSAAQMRQHPIGTGPFKFVQFKPNEDIKVTRNPDPDPILQLFYGCGSSLNWDGYCNPDFDKLIERQSREADPGRRKRVLWGIERKLAADDARPIIFYIKGGTCRQPYIKGLTLMVNSIFNGWRMEDVWLDN